MTAYRAVILPPLAVHTGSVAMSTVTVVVPESVSATAIPPVVYPFALACSLVRPAYVVDPAPMFEVDRNSAIFQLSESMSNVPYHDHGARWGVKMGNNTLVDALVQGLQDASGGYHMGITAENCADRHGISREELARAKGSLRGAYLMSYEDVGTRMTRLGMSETMRGGLTPIDEHLARLEAVTDDEVQRVAEQVLGSPRVMSSVGPR